MKRRLGVSIAAPVLWGMAALTLVACSGSAEKESVDPIEDLGLLDEGAAVVTSGVDEEGNISAEAIESEPAPIEEEVEEVSDADAGESESGVIAPPAMIIYFGYDDVVVTPNFVEVVDRVVARLTDKRSLRIRLEGHADERGTRTYNLALGERRAQSVVDMMLERGVLAEQMSWVSYGEEIPAVVGQDEDAWAKNRRVEIILEE